MVLAAWAYVVLTQKHDPPKGSPQGRFPEFEREHTPKTGDESFARFQRQRTYGNLTSSLAAHMRGQTYFFLQTTLDYKTTVETQTPHKTESGKRLWVEGRDS